MLPVLFAIGDFKVYSWGVFLLVALFLGLYWWWKLGRDEHLEETSLFDSYFLSIFSFLITGRISYVLLHLDDFGNIYRVFGILSFPGISLEGGVLGLILTILIMVYHERWEGFKIFDNLAASLGIVFLVGGIGSILAGSMVGVPVSWGINYPGYDSPRLPFDIVFFVWAIVYFLIVSRVRKDFRFYAWYKHERSVAPDGLTALIALLLVGFIYLLAGFMVENTKFGYIGYYSILGLTMIVSSIFVIYKRAGYKLFGNKK